ncbi:hypothetical protein BGZ81_001112 [Podila clonocystis]|nr:hypothetical protein BGZ81_001112 [Podila clonocystis]
MNQPGFCATAPAASAGASATNFGNYSSYPPYNTHNNINSSTSSSSTNTPSGSLYSFPPPHHMSTYDSFSTPAASTPCSAIPASRSWQQHSSGSSTPTPLILDSLAASKVNMVENLVDTAALIIESIWPSPVGGQYSPKAPVIPLHIFVKETLRRSRTTLSTLQLALYYIYKVRNQVLAAQEKIRQDQIQHLQQHMAHPPSPSGSIDTPSEEFKQRDYFNSITTYAKNNNNTLPLTPPGTNNTPASLSPLSLSSSTTTSPILAKSEPVGCGRRMFLAALILASKFQQDRTYSNKAWSKISGLPVSEINLNEITFLTLIDYRLFVSQAVFQKWVIILTEKGRVRDRASLTRSYSATDSTGYANPSLPPRRSSVQYCNNVMPSRMTCVTASSLEQPAPQVEAPHLPSFALFVGEQKSFPRSEAAGCGFKFEFPISDASGAKPSEADSSATGLVQPEAVPRQQQGMGSYLTHRWVQAQRREFLRSRMLSMGYNPNMSAPSTHAVPAPVLSKHQNQNQNQNQYESLPSPASSVSPLGMKASGCPKRRATEIEEDAERDARTRRRLSVSFLVDC